MTSRHLKPADRSATIRSLLLAAAASALSAAALAASAQAATYSVVGTGGTLHVRTAPQLAAPIVASLRDGTPMNIVCQTRGDHVAGSTMWDRIDQPVTGYVADWYTTTPVVNNPSPGLPTCGSPPGPPPTPQPPTVHTREAKVCHTQTMAGTGWQVFMVCLTADDSSNGSAVTGFVRAATCDIYFPVDTCGSFTKGSYFNSSLGTWEDWLNYQVDEQVASVLAEGEPVKTCVYLRVDTRPDGSTSYQNFQGAAQLHWIGRIPVERC